MKNWTEVVSILRDTFMQVQADFDHFERKLQDVLNIGVLSLTLFAVLVEGRQAWTSFAAVGAVFLLLLAAVLAGRWPRGVTAGIIQVNWELLARYGDMETEAFWPQLVAQYEQSIKQVSGTNRRKGRMLLYAMLLLAGQMATMVLVIALGLP